MVLTKGEGLHPAVFQNVAAEGVPNEDCTVLIIVDAVSRKYFTSETSWLWDIDFGMLNTENTSHIYLLGKYADDLYVRFSYTDVPPEKLSAYESISEGVDAAVLRVMGDFLRDKDPAVVGVLASVQGEKVTFLAVCGKETFIAPTASMTVHPVRMSGTVIAAPETYRYFERIQERIVDFVAKNSHISAEKFRSLMLDSGDMANDVGTVLYGKQAVETGLIDRVGTLSDALEALYDMVGQGRKRSEK